jgi:polyhydroxybutyrate depolymerase
MHTFYKTMAISILTALFASCDSGGTNTYEDTTIDTVNDTALDSGTDVPGEPADDMPGEVVEDVPVDEVDDDAPLSCPIAGDLGPGNHTIPLEHDSMARTYIVHVPPGYDSSTPTPLVLNLHGFSSNATQQAFFSDMNSTADSEGFVVVYPEGYANSWNAGLCCGDALAEDIDDVGFLTSVVADVSTMLCVDASRVYSSGMSNGGYMSYRLACEAPDVFAAVAPVAGALGYSPCTPSSPIPLIAYHGTADSYVDYSYGVMSFEAFGALMGCVGDPVRTMHETSFCDVYEDCDEGVQVGMCTLDGMDHCWPGGPAPRAICEAVIGAYSEDINANVHMWEFFGQFVE